MHITNLGKTDAFVPQMAGAKGVIKQVPLSVKDGAPNFSFRVFTIEPGGNTPLHSHPFEHLNYIISGTGMLMEGDTGHPVRQGDFALVLPGETHQYRNTSLEHPLVLICAVPKEYE
jgi:quercetin dioxygenase-like cupin family protein